MITRFLGLAALLLAALAGFSVMADAPVEGRAGRAEMRFLEGMSDHHQMALDMALDCLAKEVSADLKAMCQDIINAQTPEITLMQGWLLEWYNIAYTTMPMADMQAMMDTAMPGMDHSAMDHSAMAGMPATDPAMMMGMFAGFNRLEGTEYEKAWLESMIDHHDDAIHMAERLLERVPQDVGHDALLALAEKIIADQTAEIAMMETMLSELGA